MEQHEDLTDLGFHLADLPVEPHLGKMVLCAVVLKCLDPILTIACTLAYRDPFILPAEASKKKAALHCRRHFASSSFSDHMALLRAFQVSRGVSLECCDAAAVANRRHRRPVLCLPSCRVRYCWDDRFQLAHAVSPGCPASFQAWQKARSDGWERAFCEKYFLSQATMNMILGMRTQLLGQLRAIGQSRRHR